MTICCGNRAVHLIIVIDVGPCIQDSYYEANVCEKAVGMQERPSGCSVIVIFGLDSYRGVATARD